MFILNPPACAKYIWIAVLISEVQGVYSFVQHRSWESIAELAAWRREVECPSLFRQRYMLRNEPDYECASEPEQQACVAGNFSGTSLLPKDFGQRCQAKGLSGCVFNSEPGESHSPGLSGRCEHPCCPGPRQLPPPRQWCNTYLMRWCWAVVWYQELASLRQKRDY